MNRSNEVRISPILCALGWLSCFVLAWGWIMRVITLDALSVVLFIFFLLVGASAGIAMAPSKKEPPR